MFVHHVFFWLKEGISTGEVRKFEEGVKSLLTIETVKFGDVGKPASTDRPIIERTYSYSLLTAFENKEGHDAYQPPNEIHKKFVEDCSHLWTKVLIYDSESA
ncbi:MAG TPA: Dabb family protein [Chitinophagaceae bacterium]|nr:Dabb family protein [Chitinophagaceae bacterium]